MVGGRGAVNSMCTTLVLAEDGRVGVVVVPEREETGQRWAVAWWKKAGSGLGPAAVQMMKDKPAEDGRPTYYLGSWEVGARPVACHCSAGGRESGAGERGTLPRSRRPMEALSINRGAAAGCTVASNAHHLC